jgi:hypothetical protein
MNSVPAISAHPEARYDLVPVGDLAPIIAAANPATGGQAWTIAGGDAAAPARTRCSTCCGY